MDELVSKLGQEVRLLVLVYHRNKNQHRASHWWRSFNILKRDNGQILSTLRCLQQTEKDRGKYRDKLLRSLYQKLHHLMQVKVKKMYYEFNGVIALGQFVTLGVVLIGLLSRMYDIFTRIQNSYEQEWIRLNLVQVRKDKTATEKAVDTDMIVDEEIGEVIEVPVPKYSEIIPAEKKKTKKNKKKKKNSKSIIDSIFN